MAVGAHGALGVAGGAGGEVDAHHVRGQHLHRRFLVAGAGQELLVDQGLAKLGLAQAT